MVFFETSYIHELAARNGMNLWLVLGKQIPAKVILPSVGRLSGRYCRPTTLADFFIVSTSRHMSALALISPHPPDLAWTWQLFILHIDLSTALQTDSDVFLIWEIFLRVNSVPLRKKTVCAAPLGMFCVKWRNVFFNFFLSRFEPLKITKSDVIVYIFL